MRFNHGGGYQYRLCPADAKLTEECFQQTPLDFVRPAHAIMWRNGSLQPIEGKFVDHSVIGTDGHPVVPEGHVWARNPIPRIHTDNIGMAYVGKCTRGAPRRELWSAAKEDCQQFASPCAHEARAGSTAPTGRAREAATGPATTTIGVPVLVIGRSGW